MKISIILVLGGLLICGYSYSQTAEQEAIKKVCLGETLAYRNYDFDTWASYHVHSADEQLAWNNPDGSFGSQSGWETISKGMKDWFQTSQKENWKDTSDNFNFVIHGDMAFVSYSTRTQDAAGKIAQKRDYRTLLKIKGQWKILAVQAYHDYSSAK